VRYATAAALRDALDRRLVQQANGTGVDIGRLRRHVVREFWCRARAMETEAEHSAAGEASFQPTFRPSWLTTRRATPEGIRGSAA
jgi:hypothetical protein